jgi:predicted nucleotidyltransferase
MMRHLVVRCSLHRFARPAIATSTVPPVVALDGSGPAVSSFSTYCGNMPFMNQAALIEVLRRYDAALRENGATGLFIFGSRAAGTQRPESDLDLFIDYDPEVKIPNMFRLMQIEEEISEALGVPVTITTRNALTR